MSIKQVNKTYRNRILLLLKLGAEGVRIQVHQYGA
jgi:hypothetical protein